MKRYSLRAAAACTVAALLLQATASIGAEVGLTESEAAALATVMPRAPLAGQSIYFVMPDRYANADPTNDRGGGSAISTGGFDPTDIGYFHGGDLKGLTANLGRIKDLGFTAVWIAPVVLQKAVQGSSAAYHGYWGFDFTQVDPHFGSNADFKALVDAVHSNGMKLYLDIVVNHTADVITYQDGYSFSDSGGTPYKDANGVQFDLAKVMAGCAANFVDSCFPQLSAEKSFPKTIEANENSQKQPAFLQDVTNYHNRGNSFSTEGDFYGLDDIFTEKPVVVKGLADLWAKWVIDYGVDGFRIDTAMHVNSEFFNQWVPLVYQQVAAAGLQVPQMFGEIYLRDPYQLAAAVRDGGLQSVLDFPLDDALQVFAARGETAVFKEVLGLDDLYNRGAAPGSQISNVYSLVTFGGNHDEGRLPLRIWSRAANLPLSKLQARTQLAYAMLLTMRGSPTVYYGDEVGMIGASGDKSARQDMFPTKVPGWQTEVRLGGPVGTADSLGNRTHPMFSFIKSLIELRRQNPALVNGAFITRTTSLVPPKLFKQKCGKAGAVKTVQPGAWKLTCKRVKGKLIWTSSVTNQTLAWSRIDAATKTEYVVVANGAMAPRTVTLTTSTPGASFDAVFGSAAAVASDATGKLSVNLPASSLLVFKAAAQLPANVAAPTATVTASSSERVGAPVLTATLAASTDPVTVTFVGKYSASDNWFVLGSDDNPAYRLALSDWMTAGRSSLIVAAIVKTSDGKISFSAPLSLTL